MTQSTVSPQPTVSPVPPSTGQGEEMLVVDSRAGLTPSQLVERKLVTMLRSGSLPVSQLQSARYTRR